MRILYVCTANICRSVAAAHVLRESLSVDPLRVGVEVRSAGTMAVPGLPGCSAVAELLGSASGHESQPLTRELVDWADLILTAAREHRASVADFDPAARQRTFTIRQAARIAGWLIDARMVAAGLDRAVGEDDWADRFAPGDPRRDVPPMPHAGDERTQWMVSEMDAARGMSVVRHARAADVDPAGGRRRLGWVRRGRGGQRPAGDGYGGRRSDLVATENARGEDASGSHPDDVNDPHVLGWSLHPATYQQLTAATLALVELLRAVDEVPDWLSPPA